MIIAAYKNTSGEFKLVFAFAISLAATVMYPLREYFILDSTLIVGLATAPFLIQASKGKFSYRFLLPALLFLLMSFFFHAKTFLFLSFIFCFLLIIENTWGKISWLFFYLLLIISPFFKFFSNIIGFPVRLWLSEISGIILNAAGKEVNIEGNLILMDGSEFSVDPACMGLKMLSVSMVLSLFLIGHFQKRYCLRISLISVSSLLFVAICLNIISNLVRIILLVLFKIMPGNPFHDVVGLLGLLVYVLIPLYFLSRLTVRKTGKHPGEMQTQKTKGIKNIVINSVLIVATLILTVFHFDNTIADNQAPLPFCFKEGFQKETLRNGIVKLENKEALIYIKPLQFYSAEHNPMICWSGSGYEFRKINKIIIEGQEVYYGVLEKQEDVIYSAWWFDNGSIKTIDQFEWRWDALVNKNTFSLINVNAAFEKDLINQASELIKGNLFANLKKDSKKTA